VTTVSVLIPCFNARPWIAEAIESALAQTWPATEVIVVDDGSTDGSLDVIKQYEGRIRWETGSHRGGNGARNRLLELSTGEWLQYLDADDYLLPKKLEHQLTFIPHSDADVVCSPVKLRCERLSPVEHLTHIPEPHNDPWVLLARWWLPQTGGALWKRSTVLEVGGWKLDQPCCQEHELYARLLMNGATFVIADECHSVWRDWSVAGTVSTRDSAEVRRRRLAILDGMEQFLLKGGRLTPARRQAVNQARFEIARGTWNMDRAASAAIMQQVRASQPSFRGEPPAANTLYRIMFRLVGFQLTEFAARVKRACQSRRIASGHTMSLGTGGRDTSGSVN
jgi:glycosyltransferase involved in cell wall biosynthesis